MDYWNSTAVLTEDGSVVDYIISPVAPWPAARRELFTYVGYTTWVNLLDYTSVVIPVTTASKELDPVDRGYVPINDFDKDAFEACKCSR
jgi:amidase